MSCFTCGASGVLQVPQICKNVQNMRWKLMSVPWSNLTNSLSCLCSFILFLSFRWHVIVSPSVTESCKRLASGYILGNTHTNKRQCVKHNHLRASLISIWLIIVVRWSLFLLHLRNKNATKFKCGSWVTCQIIHPNNPTRSLSKLSPHRLLSLYFPDSSLKHQEQGRKGMSEFLLWGEKLKMNVGRIL